VDSEHVNGAFVKFSETDRGIGASSPLVPPITIFFLLFSSIRYNLTCPALDTETDSKHTRPYGRFQQLALKNSLVFSYSNECSFEILYILSQSSLTYQFQSNL